MSRYRLSPRVEADLQAVSDYSTSRWGKKKTLEYLFAIKERFEWLADNPLLGRSRDEVRVGLRSYRQGSHMIFYRIVDEGVEVVGIPHASMDFDKYFD